MSHEQNQRAFYAHLKHHPNAHASARAFANKLVAKDPAAKAALQALASRGDARSCHALRAVAVVVKYEHGNIFAGGIAGTGGKILKVALSPAAWVLRAGGQSFRWVGSTLQQLSHAI